MKTIIYIVLGVLWYIYKYSKKKKDAQTEGQYAEEIESTPKQSKTKGFQELLDEFVNEESVEEEIINPSLDNKIELKPVYEPLKVEKVKVADEFKRFEEFDIEEDSENEYSELFSDQDAVKKAFIASEVLNRKY